jgi:hypothetical protein
MWQRIQTVFLAIAIIALIVSIFCPVWTYQDTLGQEHQLFPLHYTVKQNAERTTEYFPYSLTAILIIASATLALFEIGKYKNRMLQMKLGALNSLFMAGSIGSAVYFGTQLVKTYQAGQYGLGLWLPGVAVICNLLANRFIRRDEKLVRDSDRLR